MAFDDEGAIPVQDYDADQHAPVQDDNSGAPPVMPPMPQPGQQGSDNLGAIAEAGKQTPLEGAKQFPGNVKRIVSYLMGEGATPPQALAQAAAQVDPEGAMSPDDRNLLAVQQAHDTGGPEAAWKLVQANRVAYNAKQAFAKTALSGINGKPADINSALDAANQAASHILDGSSVTFAPSQGGVVATVKMPGADTPQQIPLTMDQFNKWLDVGKDGQWDKVMEKSAPATLTALSQAVQQPQQAPQQQQPGQRQPQRPQGGAPAPQQRPQRENYEQMQNRAPISEAVRTGKPQAMDPTQADQPAIPGTHDARGHYIGPARPDATNYGGELEARSRKMFPSVNEEQQRQQWMAGQEQQGTKNEIDMARAKQEGRVDAARINASSRENVQNTRSASNERVADTNSHGKMEAIKQKTLAEAAKLERQSGDRAAQERGRNMRAFVSSPNFLLMKPEDYETAAKRAGVDLGAAAAPQAATPQAPTPQGQQPAAPAGTKKMFNGKLYTREEYERDVLGKR